MASCPAIEDHHPPCPNAPNFTKSSSSALLRTLSSAGFGGAKHQGPANVEKEEILRAFEMLNEILQKNAVNGEICLYGGAVMCVVYDARPSTKDVDAIFQPSSTIRDAAVEVAKRMNLPDQWLNDGVKGFVVPHGQKVWLNLPNLTVYVAETDYLFAMKALAARVDTSDREDIRLLLREMEISNLEEALGLVEKYYPRNQIKPATRFFLEELFDENEDA
jgi:hypothetical protein